MPLWNHFRTIFVKPENAINIPEKYRKKIQSINNEEVTEERKKSPIRIKQSSIANNEGTEDNDPTLLRENKKNTAIKKKV